MQSAREPSRRRGERGQAMVEVALMSPWIFFLFIGIMDTGFFCYSAICVENAARAAAMTTALNQQQVTGTANDFACRAAWNELSNLPNVYSKTEVTTCGGLPAGVTVVTNTLCGSATSNIVGCTAGASCSDCDGTPWDKYPVPKAAQVSKAASSQVIVTYTSVPVVPIPGIFPNRYTLTRIAEARIIQE